MRVPFHDPPSAAGLDSLRGILEDVMLELPRHEARILHGAHKFRHRLRHFHFDLQKVCQSHCTKVDEVSKRRLTTGEIRDDLSH